METKNLKVTLEIVTPLFLGGAEPRGVPELRAPSFRGALRYWLRAALGGMLGDDVETMRKEEAIVFGSAGDDTGGVSSIIIRTQHDSLFPKPKQYKKQDSITIHKAGRKIKQPTGRDYLYWSMAESGKPEKGNYQPPKQFYPPGACFDLILALRLGEENPDKIFKRVTVALWLLVHLGGIGSRSRRTGGSLSVPEKVEIEGLEFYLIANNTAETAFQLGKGLKRLREFLGTPDFPHVPSVPSFEILHPDVCKIWVLGVYKSWEDAVENIGCALRDFRTYAEPDHTNVADWLKGNPIPTVERAIFGLPLPFRYSGGGLSGSVRGRLKEPTIERRASPLWLKVSKTANGEYAGIATLFKSAFLPANEKLYIRKDLPSITPPKSYSLVEQWIKKSFPKCQEVDYA
ncbi:MAG: type III-B CRISPR module RAMP protein Cmr1 [Bacillota bacterium]|nr:type III-B CRISPR module RAMP protein Cmr1 [Bacillota bacterium]